MCYNSDPISSSSFYFSVSALFIGPSLSVFNAVISAFLIVTSSTASFSGTLASVSISIRVSSFVVPFCGIITEGCSRSLHSASISL